jgi:hypothetical protein
MNLNIVLYLLFNMKSKYQIIMLVVILSTVSFAGLSTQGLNNLAFASAFDLNYGKGNSINDQSGMLGTAMHGNFNGNSAKCCSDSMTCNDRNANDQNGNAHAGHGGIAIGGAYNGNSPKCCFNSTPCHGGNANGENGNANGGVGGKAFGGAYNGNSAFDNNGVN